MSAYRDDVRPDEAADEAMARFITNFRMCADHYGGIIIDGSRMAGTGDWALHFEAVADGRLEHVKDEVIDGVKQVPFFRVTDAGRAWIAQVAR